VESLDARATHVSFAKIAHIKATVERQSIRFFEVGNIKYEDYTREVGGDIQES